MVVLRSSNYKARYLKLATPTPKIHQMQNRLSFLTPLDLPSATRWFYLFLVVHLLCWTLVPAFVRLNLPLDTIEGTIWGHQLEWGYDKNPYLNGWLTALAIHLGESGWGAYLFSQLSVAACLWSVWQLAIRMLPPAEALLSVLLLEGLQYFNFHAIDFNDNTLELGLWGLSSYFFYRALHENRYLPWLLTGFFTGLGLMAKYYTAVLITSMLLLLLVTANYRKLLKTLPPYFGLFAFLVVTVPHIIWLFSHDFITVQYVFARAASKPSWTNHFFFPAQFVWQQVQVLIPSVILLILFLIGKRPLLSPTRFSLTNCNLRFLLFIGLGPLILTILFSLSLGTNLRAGWGMPLLSFMGIILVSILQPNVTINKMYRFLGVIFVLLSVTLSLYTTSLISSKDESTANFPGKAIAEVITHEWHERYHTSLEYVAGSRWVGGNIGFYSSDHPAVFIEWNPSHAPWVDMQKLKEKGGVFVWQISANEKIPETIKQQFPSLSEVSIREFDWQRNRHHLAPVKLGIAFLPPAI